ncbi:unnamed protein product [Caenorhabditis angaria]|uniref:Seven TM Receptor n=1 Tax=Caenorhabditis angaria TaxID=860376 RepID=A0A9P1IN48_9PELO|nr:unnamed protein product [Caenorhabditis angaria]
MEMGISNQTVVLLDLAKVVDILSFCLSSIIFIVLIYLIISYSPAHFGNYTYLLMVFSMNSWIFALAHAFLQPVISVEKYVLFVFSPTNYMQFSKTTIRALLAIYGISYSQTIVFIAVQFIYRYLAICHRSYLYLFDRKFLVFWYLLIVVFGFNWGFCIFYIAKETPETDAIIGPVLENSFGLKIENVNYVAANYYMSNGVDLNLKTIFMVVNFAIIIGSSLVVITICCIKIWNKFGTIKNSQDSQDLLVTALTFQMIIPLFLLYVPILVVLALPVFKIQNEAIVSFTSIIISLYPLFDATTMIAIIPYYRNGFVKLMTPSKVSNQIENLDF